MANQIQKVRTYRWESGTLKSFDYFFDTIEQSLTFGKNSNAPVVKVYHYDGSLIECFMNSEDEKFREIAYT